MYKLTFTLKQHTPLIHFQHDQEGATLRASEVKPKLDMFLIEKLQMITSIQENGKEVPKEIYKKWFINEGKQHLALDYKMMINVNESPKEYFIVSYLNNEKKRILTDNNIITISPSPYFAQEEYTKKIINKNNQINFREWSTIGNKGIIFDSIKITVFCYNEELLVKIKIYINEFFVCQNFGSRQNKGFGCFEIIEPVSLKTFEKCLIDNYDFVYKKTFETSNLNTLFEEIQHDYKLLKSGRNKDSRRRSYAKSKLFLYGLKMPLPIRWEKRFLKLNVHNVYALENSNYFKLKVNIGNSSNYGDKNNDKSWKEPHGVVMKYYYLRALLGLTDKFEFLVEGINSKFNISVKNNNGIERFKSPLNVIVNDEAIYIVGNELQPDIYSKLSSTDFNFVVTLKSLNNNSEDPYFDGDDADTLDDNLKIPKNFSLREFMKFAMNDNTNGATLGYTTIKE